MTISTLSKHAQAFIDAIIAAYDAGGSYDTVARELDTSTTRVQTIMRKYAPDSIRTPEETLKVRPQYIHSEHGLTLTALGLYAVGPCKKCRIEIVSKTRKDEVKLQTCGLCLAYASTQAAKKDERQYVTWYAKKYGLSVKEAWLRVKRGSAA